MTSELTAADRPTTPPAAAGAVAVDPSATASPAAGPGPTSPRPRAALVLALLGAAAGLGVLTEWLQGVLVDPWAMWANSIAAWVVVAFAAGALVRGGARAALAGVGAELLLVAGYYVARTVHDVPSDLGTLLFWVGGAVVGGIVFGLAGSWWRSDVVWRQVTGLALLCGVLVSEGLVRWLLFPWQGASGAILCAVGLVAAVLLARTPRQRWLVPLALAATVPLGLAGAGAANHVLSL